MICDWWILQEYDNEAEEAISSVIVNYDDDDLDIGERDFRKHSR